jgi:mRNA interferase HigB
MHVISRKALRSFWEQYPDSKAPLVRWFQIVRATKYANWEQMRRTFPSADRVDKWVVFNVGGNKYRLITVVHFNRGKIYIRHVLTHREYDRGAWKQ